MHRKSRGKEAHEKLFNLHHNFKHTEINKM
jgi:hypothetical protein